MILDGVDYPRLRVRTSRHGAHYYYDHGGKPRRWEALGGDVKRALDRYRKLAGAPRPVAGTVDAMLADVIEHLRGKVKPGTLANYEGFRKHLVDVFDPDPTTIDQADVLRYLAECPRSSFRGEIALLSQAFAHAMLYGRLRFNPCFGVRTKRKGSKRDRIFAPAELQAIIDAADDRLALAIELAYATGLRIGDCCRLRWADVGGATFALQKTGAPTALDPSDALAPILSAARTLQARVASLYVLCDRRGRPWKPKTLRKRWDTACRHAVVDDAHFHDIRATAITEVARLYGQEEARKFAGHKDLRTTIGYVRSKSPNVVRPLLRKSST